MGPRKNLISRNGRINQKNHQIGNCRGEVHSKAKQLEIEGIKRGRILRAEEKTRCYLRAVDQRLVEVTIMERSSLPVEIVVKELRVKVQKEIVEGEILRAEEERLLDLAALQLCGIHILNKRQRSVNPRYKVQLVKGSCVTFRGEYTRRVLKCCTYEVWKCCSVVKL